MLDRITPADKKGAVHGVNNAVFKFSVAVFQLALGIVADKFGSLLTLWICVGVRNVHCHDHIVHEAIRLEKSDYAQLLLLVSFFASLVNLPLVCYPLLGTMEPDKDDDDTVYINEDNIQELLDQAEYVPVQVLFEVNKSRAEIGLPFLQSRFGTYSREHIEKFSLTHDDLRFLRAKMKARLHIIHEYPEMKKLYMQS